MEWKEKKAWEDRMIETFKFEGKLSKDYGNLLELIFDTVHCLVIDNYENTKLSLSFVDSIKQYPFVSKVPQILSIIFKGKFLTKNDEASSSYSSTRINVKNKLYSKIYEYDKISELVPYYIRDLRNSRLSRYLHILRSLSVIDKNPLPLIQKEIFTELYVNSRYQDSKAIEDMMEESKEEAQNTLISELKRRTSLRDVKEQSQASELMIDPHCEGMPQIKIVDISNNEEEEKEEYIVQQLALESNLCMGRNNACIEYFSK